MSAPAMKLSLLPEMSTALVMLLSRSMSSKRTRSSSARERLKVLTGAPGTSSERMATPDSRVSVIEGIRSVLVATLDHHRVAHSARGANGHEAELSVATPELVDESGQDAPARRAEGVSNGDRAAHDIQPLAIDLADRLREAGPLGPFLRDKALEVG